MKNHVYRCDSPAPCSTLVYILILLFLQSSVNSNIRFTKRNQKKKASSLKKAMAAEKPTTSSKNLRELTAVSDSDLLFGSTALASIAFDGLDNLQ
jgi:hypothetical protein